MTQITPAKAAKQWAATNPAVEAEIIVKLLAPRGKRGRLGLGSKRTFWFASLGKTAGRRSKNLTDPFVHAPWNGICDCCGKVILESVIYFAIAPDPEAGEPVPSESQYRIEYQMGGADKVVWADYAYVRACPDCIQSRELIRFDPRDERWMPVEPGGDAVDRGWKISLWGSKWHNGWCKPQVVFWRSGFRGIVRPHPTLYVESTALAVVLDITGTGVVETRAEVGDGVTL